MEAEINRNPANEPQHPENSEPSKLKDEVRCPDTVAEETNNHPKQSIDMFQYICKHEAHMAVREEKWGIEGT